MRIQVFLNEYAKKHPVSFHMPGHKGARLYKRFGYDPFLQNLMNWDITEIPGADNLFQAEGSLKEIQDGYAEQYGAKKSYLQINGSSGGLISAILATVPKGKKLIMARNCHKSVFNALVLGDIEPVYVHPSVNEEYGVTGEISPQAIDKCLETNPDAAAVILPSPNYYGICSDIESISTIVHKHNKILIVDQAHGAHLTYFNKFGVSTMPLSAENSGADIVVDSTHKTLASYTQSAVMNVMTDRVDLDTLEDKLQCIESSSPSYILMASLDINLELMERCGQMLINDWENNLDYFYQATERIDGLEIMKGFANFDRTKINLNMSALGISGTQLEKLLIQENIYPELITGDILMCMTGIGNVRSDYERLMRVLHLISNAAKRGELPVHLHTINPTPPATPTFVEIPKTKQKIALEDAEGKICASSIIPYPPGVPVVCPGERIDADTIAYISNLRKNGEKVIGISPEGEIYTG